MNDLAIASRVKADLALNSSSAQLEFDVESKDGRVTIRGKLPNLELVEEIKSVASAVTGVKEVAVLEVVSMTPA